MYVYMTWHRPENRDALRRVSTPLMEELEYVEDVAVCTGWVLALVKGILCEGKRTEMNSSS